MHITSHRGRGIDKFSQKNSLSSSTFVDYSRSHYNHLTSQETYIHSYGVIVGFSVRPQRWPDSILFRGAHSPAIQAYLPCGAATTTGASMIVVSGGGFGVIGPMEGDGTIYLSATFNRTTVLESVGGRPPSNLPYRKHAHSPWGATGSVFRLPHR